MIEGSGHIGFVEADSACTYLNSNGTTNVADGAWHHLAVTWPGTGGTAFMYLDGVQVGQTTQVSGAPTNNADPVRIGVTRWNVSGIYRYFTGGIDEVRIYDRALSGVEIAELASGSPCGNGTLDPGEECDDGNLVNGDGCSDECLIERCEPPPTGLATWDFEEPGTPLGAELIDHQEGPHRNMPVDYDYASAIFGSESVHFYSTGDQTSLVIFPDILSETGRYTISGLGYTSSDSSPSIASGVVLNGATCNFAGQLGFQLGDASVTARPVFGSAAVDVVYLFVLKVWGDTGAARCEIYDSSGSTLLEEWDQASIEAAPRYIRRAGLFGSGTDVSAFWDDVTLYEGIVDPLPGAACCGDGILDPDEECDDGNGVNNDGCSLECLLDQDLDEVPDQDDNCPLTPNPDQGDVDGDGLGDVCDDDDLPGLFIRHARAQTASETVQRDKWDAKGEYDASGEPGFAQQVLAEGISAILRKQDGSGGVLEVHRLSLSAETCEEKKGRITCEDEASKSRVRLRPHKDTGIYRVEIKVRKQDLELPDLAETPLVVSLQTVDAVDRSAAVTDCRAGRSNVKCKERKKAEDDKCEERKKAEDDD